jgi:outer membrane protein TolC
MGAFGVIDGEPIPGGDSTVTTPAQMTFMISASVSQPLTGLVRTRLAVRQGEAAVALARQNSRAARLEVVQQVRQVYYAILEATSALDATASNRRLLTELTRVVVTRVAERTALPADRLDVEARLASLRVTELSLENAVATGRERLNRLLGRAIDTPFAVSPLDAMAMDAHPPGASSPADHPAVREAALRTEQAVIAEEQARADRLPDLNLLLQTMTPINIDGAPRNVTAAGLQLKWEPFDWGRKSHAIAARRLDAERADRTRRDVESAAAVAVNQARRAMDYAQATLRAALAAQYAAREHARVRAAQYETRAALLSDALQAEASLADSGDRYHRAVIALLTARADLEYALGEDPLP